MKRDIYSKSSIIITHFFLLVLFAFLPFIFSDTLIETETTLRFIISGSVLSVLFLSFFLFITTGADIRLPAIRGDHFYKILILSLVFSAVTIARSLNKGEAIYDYLKICTIVSYFFLFVILLKNKENFLPTLLKYSNVAIWIYTLIALSQLGLQLRAANKIKVDYLLSSSLGNKNFYAETMTLFLPLILMGAATLKGKWRVISVINTVIILITVIALQTLSTWIAIAVFILFLSGMLIYLIRKNSLSIGIFKGRKAQVLILGSLLTIIVAMPLLYHVNHFNLIRKRVDKITEYVNSNGAYTRENTYQTNSIAERIFLWKNAWRMFKDYPVMGAGFDNWKIYNTKYELPFSKYIMNNSTRYLRPHNDLMLLLAEGGIVGLLLFLSLFLYALMLFFRLVKAPSTREDKTILLLAASGLLIYLVIACFSLPGDRFYTQVLLFLFFAIICARYEVADTTDSRTDRGLMAMICIAAIVSGVSIVYIGVKRYASEIHLVYALQAQSKKDWQKMGYHASMAKNFFFPIDYTATPIAWYQGMASFNSGAPAISKYYFEEALRSNPYDLNVLNDLATTIQREGDNAKALSIYDQALDMAPFFTDAFMNKVVVLYNQGDREKAYTYLHTYPRYHADDHYDRILTIMLTNKAIDAISDTTLSRRYLKGRINLLRMDSTATADHIPFEQLVLRDTVLTHLK